MESRGDRKSFFRNLLRESLSVVHEVRDSVERSEYGDDGLDENDWHENPRAAERASQTATINDLRTLARGRGIEGHLDDLARLARASIRATPAADESVDHSVTRLGGSPDLPRGFAWPTNNDKPLSFVGQFDLADCSRLLSQANVPDRGLLSFFAEAGPSASVDDVACKVLYFDEALDERVTAPIEAELYPEYAVDLSCELTVPHAWSLPVEPLELDEQEAAAWDQLRADLAAFQGVELDELASDWLVIHRLLGYPEAVGGPMELDVELGRWDLATGNNVLSEADELGEHARGWQLLLQASDDGAFHISQHPHLGRLYFWIRATDLPALRFEGVRAVVR